MNVTVYITFTEKAERKKHQVWSKVVDVPDAVLAGRLPIRLHIKERRVAVEGPAVVWDEKIGAMLEYRWPDTEDWDAENDIQRDGGWTLVWPKTI